MAQQCLDSWWLSLLNVQLGESHAGSHQLNEKLRAACRSVWLDLEGSHMDHHSPAGLLFLLATRSGHGRASLGFILRMVRSWRREGNLPQRVLLGWWEICIRQPKAGVATFWWLHLREPISGSLNCFAPGDRVEHGMAFSITGVMNATKLVLETLCYSWRSPSSSAVGSAPASFMQWAAGTGHHASENSSLPFPCIPRVPQSFKRPCKCFGESKCLHCLLAR